MPNDRQGPIAIGHLSDRTKKWLWLSDGGGKWGCGRGWGVGGGRSVLIHVHLSQ